LGLHGLFYEVQEPLFYHRIHAENSVHNKKRQERTAWFDTSKIGKLTFPNWRQLCELLIVITRSPLPWPERLRCYGHMLYWVKKRRKRLGRDLVWAARQVI
jgi:hypothetical protein